MNNLITTKWYEFGFCACLCEYFLVNICYISVHVVVFSHAEWYLGHIAWALSAYSEHAARLWGRAG